MRAELIGVLRKRIECTWCWMATSVAAVLLLSCTDDSVRVRAETSSGSSAASATETTVAPPSSSTTADGFVVPDPLDPTLDCLPYDTSRGTPGPWISDYVAPRPGTNASPVAALAQEFGVYQGGQPTPELAELREILIDREAEIIARLDLARTHSAVWELARDSARRRVVAVDLPEDGWPTTYWLELSDGRTVARYEATRIGADAPDFWVIGGGQECPDFPSH